MKPLRIVVLEGGPSPEAEISRRTAQAVAQALTERGYLVERWELNQETLARFIHDPPEFVFPALHGWGGEDGRIQGFLDLLSIPYAGSGPLSSALAMDKARCRRFLSEEVRQPRYIVCSSSDVPPTSIPFPPPWVVKPSGGGSSLGVSIVEDSQKIDEALKEAYHYDTTALIEERIPGRELSVGVVWGEILGIVEIVPKEDFYNYTAKYSGTSQYLLDPDLSPSHRDELYRQALRAYELLGCRGCIRVDFIATSDTPYFLEVNTIPGMTENSLIPKMGAARGITFSELVEWIAFPEAKPQTYKGGVKG